MSTFLTVQCLIFQQQLFSLSPHVAEAKANRFEGFHSLQWRSHANTSNEIYLVVIGRH
jgi:hypothetical protein